MSRPFLYRKHLLLQVCENWRLSLILPSDTGDVKACGALDKVKAYLEKHCQSNLFQTSARVCLPRVEIENENEASTI